MAIIVYSLFITLSKNSIVSIIISLICVLLFGVYLIYHTLLIVGGKSF